MSSPLHVAIVGATGAVGIELMKVLARRDFPVGRLTLLASARSAGKTLDFQGEATSIPLMASMSPSSAPAPRPPNDSPRSPSRPGR
jgi:aspartate-semialdehyde dehydrogenase